MILSFTNHYFLCRQIPALLSFEQADDMMKESKWNAGFEDEFPQSVLTEETANVDYM
jgi:hypothetical protein